MTEYVRPELVDELERLRACKGQLNILIRMVNALPEGEERERGLSYVNAICDALESEAENLKSWHEALQGKLN